MLFLDRALDLSGHLIATDATIFFVPKKVCVRRRSVRVTDDPARARGVPDGPISFVTVISCVSFLVGSLCTNHHHPSPYHEQFDFFVFFFLFEKYVPS